MRDRTGSFSHRGGTVATSMPAALWERVAAEQREAEQREERRRSSIDHSRGCTFSTITRFSDSPKAEEGAAGRRGSISTSTPPLPSPPPPHPPPNVLPGSMLCPGAMEASRGRGGTYESNARRDSIDTSRAFTFSTSPRFARPVAPAAAPITASPHTGRSTGAQQLDSPEPWSGTPGPGTYSPPLSPRPGSPTSASFRLTEERFRSGRRADDTPGPGTYLQTQRAKYTRPGSAPSYSRSAACSSARSIRAVVTVRRPVYQGVEGEDEGEDEGADADAAGGPAVARPYAEPIAPGDGPPTFSGPADAVRALLEAPLAPPPAAAHREAPSLYKEAPPYIWKQEVGGTTRARVVKALSVANTDSHRLAVLASVLAAGPREWWALPLVLGSRCSGRTWEDDSLVRFAAKLHGAVVGAPTVDSRQMMVHALRPHPMLNALVAMMASDEPAMREAARRCSPAEIRQVTRIAYSSATYEEGRPAALLKLNLALWFAAIRDMHTQGGKAHAGDAQSKPQGKRVAFLDAARKPPVPKRSPTAPSMPPGAPAPPAMRSAPRRPNEPTSHHPSRNLRPTVPAPPGRPRISLAQPESPTTPATCATPLLAAPPATPASIDTPVGNSPMIRQPPPDLAPGSINPALEPPTPLVPDEEQVGLVVADLLRSSSPLRPEGPSRLRREDAYPSASPPRPPRAANIEAMEPSPPERPPSFFDTRTAVASPRTAAIDKASRAAVPLGAPSGLLHAALPSSPYLGSPGSPLSSFRAPRRITISRGAQSARSHSLQPASAGRPGSTLAASAGGKTNLLSGTPTKPTQEITYRGIDVSTRHPLHDVW